MRTQDRIQREYYTRTAAHYDHVHVQMGDEHYVALKYISGFLAVLGASSILDVGCGTGRGIRYFLEQAPDVKVYGVEPVQALLEQAKIKNDIPVSILTCSVAESLPFYDGSIDAVCALGVLHHVRRPNLAVAEVMRVARRAVFLSDGNRFGQRGLPVRWLKLALYKLGLWGAVDFIKTYGKGYTLSETDGLAYSYSVFDSFDLIAERADRVILIPTRKEKATSWFHTLLTASTVLLCGIKEE